MCGRVPGLGAGWAPDPGHQLSLVSSGPGASVGHPPDSRHAPTSQTCQAPLAFDRPERHPHDRRALGPAGSREGSHGFGGGQQRGLLCGPQRRAVGSGCGGGAGLSSEGSAVCGQVGSRGELGRWSGPGGVCGVTPHSLLHPLCSQLSPPRLPLRSTSSGVHARLCSRRGRVKVEAPKWASPATCQPPGWAWAGLTSAGETHG